MGKPGGILKSGRAVAVGLISLVLGALAAQGVSASPLLVLASFAVFSYVVIACGQLIARAAHASDLPLVASWGLGVAATAIALLILVALLPINAAVAFAIWAAVIIALDITTGTKGGPGVDRADVIGVLLCCALTAVWCRETAAVPVQLASTGRLAAWIDYLLHAGVISQFGDPRAVSRGSIWLADTPWSLYHYASYTLPAAFAAPLDQPGLPLATSVWVPIGFLSLAAGAYTLGVTLAGSAGGIAALAALLVMPDASNYGLRNGFFSFHWVLFASPTTSYALGTALLAAVFLHRGVAAPSRWALVLSGALAIATALFRAHVFGLLFPAWLAVVAVASQTVQRRRVLFLLLVGCCAIGAVVALRFAPQLPPEFARLFDEGRALERFLYLAHRRQEPTGYQGLYQRVHTEFGESAGFAAGVLLVYPACLGVLLVLYPLALFLLRGRLQLRGVDGLALALLVAYAAILLLAPIPAHHDSSEFTHRPFALLYALVAVWTAASLVRWLSGKGEHGKRLWQTLVVSTALALPLVWANAALMTRPKFNWGKPFIAHVVPGEFHAAADFLRDRARPSDTFATSGLPRSLVAVDAATELVALTGIPTYLARLWVHEALGGATRSTAIGRYVALGEVAQAGDTERAMQKLRELRVRWYVVTSPAEPAWDPQRGRAAWTRGAVAIYDSRPAP